MWGAPAHAKEELRTIVLDLKGRRGVDEGLAAVLTDVVQGEVASQPGRKAYSSADVKRLMQFEAERVAIGCDDDSCVAELASALDVDRVITGSISKVGTKFFVVLSEFDSENVEPIARLQKAMPANEDLLMTGVKNLTRELLRRSAARKPATVAKAQDEGPAQNANAVDNRNTDPDDVVAKATTAPPTAPREVDLGKGAALVVNSTPMAEVHIDGKPVGPTPATVELAPGPHEVILKRNDTTDVLIDVALTADKPTEISTRLDLPGGVPSKAQDRYEAQTSSQVGSGWTKIGVGAGACVGINCLSSVLLIVAATAVPNENASLALGVISLVVAPAVAFGAGAVGCGWGGIDLLTLPEEPLPDERLHEVNIRRDGEAAENYTVGSTMAH